jgi:hypothetical protein
MRLKRGISPVAALTSGTFSGSVCDEAASVVTNLKAGRAAGATRLRRNGDAMLRLIVLDSIVMLVQRRKRARGEGEGQVRLQETLGSGKC